MVCTGLLTQGCWLQIFIWFYYTTKHFLKMPPDSFIQKFIEFLLCPLGHRCEPSEHSGVGVRSAKKPGQKCMVNAPAKWMPSTGVAKRRVGWLCRAGDVYTDGEFGIRAGSLKGQEG